MIGIKLIAPPNLEIQAAYAPLKHLLVMGNGSYFSFKNNDRQTSYEHYLVEGGAGLFTAFWKNRCDNKIARAAFMGGWGIGGADITRNPISFFS